MASTINATTSSGIVATADNTGQLALQAAGTTIATISSTGLTMNSGNIVQASGAAPAFSAYPNTDTSVPNSTSTVVANNTKEFDTAGCYNNTGSTVGGIPAYSFLPNVAGYYLFTATCDDEQSTAAVSRFILTVDKNGSGYRVFDDMSTVTSVISGSVLLYMNGTTDSVRMSVYIASTGAKYGGNLSVTRFSGFMVRSA